MTGELWDIHTHILPGIDDGAKDWETSMEMIGRAWDSGVRNIIATPHYLPWKENAAPDKIRQLCGEAQERAVRQLGKEIRIHPGQEVFFHIDMTESLQKGDILTLAGSRHVLVEFPVGASYTSIFQSMGRIRSGGYQPVLAHLERYPCLRERGKLQELKGLGVLVQMNLQSLDDGIFSGTKYWCREQLLRNTIDFLASDMHNLSGRPPFSREDFRWIDKKLKTDYLREILHDNANQRFV